MPTEIKDSDRTLADALNALNALSRICHSNSKEAGWWANPIDGFLTDRGIDLVEVGSDEWLELVTPTKLALIHSEISEAMEGFRKDLMDDHLPDRKMAEVELADALIRIFDLAGAHGFDLGGAFVEKLNYNVSRIDHKREHRQQKGGKKF